MSDIEKIGNIIVGVFQLNGLLLSWGDRFAGHFELTSARWQVLGALYRNGAPLTAPQIAAKMGQTRQGVQKQLNLLLAAKQVEKRPNAAHKRSPLYALTPKGEALFAEINSQWEKFAGCWAAEFSPEQIDQTEQVITKLIKIIEQEKSS